MPQSNIPLGDTENVFFGTQEVDTLIINGTTVWQKVIALPQDIDGDGIANASDNTPAIRLRGIRQSGGGINWYVYVIFTNTSLTHAKIYVSGGAQFSGNLQDTETLSDQGVYKTAAFSSSSMSTNISNYYQNGDFFRSYNSTIGDWEVLRGNVVIESGLDGGEAEDLADQLNHMNYAYFRFPVSTNGSSYTDSQTTESIQVKIPAIGSNTGDEASQYLNQYQQIISP